jgi:hypothetical protein
MKNEYKYAFPGVHCETTATGTLLKSNGIDLSEPMLFGLAQGLGFIYWNMKIMDFPFIGGRIKPDLITHNLSQLLNLTLNVQETTSIKKAWTNIKNHLASNKPVGLKLDCYHLEYFTNKIHFAGHYVAIHELDDQYAYLVDTIQQGKNVKTSLKNLELARNERGPMSSKNLSYTIGVNGETPSIRSILPVAIEKNAQDFLNPPIKNIGYKGILKTSGEVVKWFKKSEHKKSDFTTTAMLMEKAGTGGALFRNLYRDFLFEAQDYIENKFLSQAHREYTDIAKSWENVSTLFNEAGESEDIKHIHEASKLLVDLSKQEKEAMELLLHVNSVA